MVRLNRFSRGLAYLLSWLVQLPLPPSTRASVLRLFGAEIGDGTRVHRIHPINLEVAGLKHLKVGKACHLGAETLIDLAAPVEILDRTTIGPRVTLLTHADPGAAAPALERAREVGGLRIGPDAWVGAAAVLMPGTRIGAQVIVGAGSVVTRSVQDGITVAGVPARQVERPSATEEMYGSPE